MATYKLIQDIEAEDHILGPLTLRQFIFALIAAFFIYLNFLAVSKHAALLLIILLPPALFFGFFAVPFGRDQPTEVWALAKLRFWLKPRKRIWDQSGVKQLVTINAPKKIERVLTNNLSSFEVQSRLKTLAKTLDSRGWAVKNSGLQNLNPPIIVSSQAGNDSDRLLDISSIAPPVPEEIDPTDLLDEQRSPLAQHFDKMIDESNQAHHQQLLDLMNSDSSQPTGQLASQSNQWFMPHQSSTSLPVAAPDVPAQVESDDERAMAAQLKAKHAVEQNVYSNLRTLQPIGTKVNPPTTAQAKSLPVSDNNSLTSKADPAILSLANNDDFDVATIAREAKRANGGDADEVVIPLR